MSEEQAHTFRCFRERNSSFFKEFIFIIIVCVFLLLETFQKLFVSGTPER